MSHAIFYIPQCIISSIPITAHDKGAQPADPSTLTEVHIIYYNCIKVA
jgi:hypothetical protein